MDAPKFITMRLGKDSVDDIRVIDARNGGIQEPPYVLTVTCKQVPRSLDANCFAVLWLGSDNSKGMATDWKQGIRAVAKVIDVKLGANHNDDSDITVSIGYIFGQSINKIDLIDSYANAYRHFSELPLVGLNDYSNQTVREIDAGPRRKVGALLAACGRASSSSLMDILAVYPELKNLDFTDFDEGCGPKDSNRSFVSQPRNYIFFGAPGTGKSHELNEIAEDSFPEANVSRVTFYPDYTYSQFVGCFKPMTGDAGDGKTEITYQYVPGPFLNTYIDATTHPEQDYLLIVEEINRANPAAVFGDVFQLLDRDPDGRSEYSVAAPIEMQKTLAAGGIDSGKLALPSNMYIWATMNSADQGVFPMDTAFKRRWDFRYMGINEGEDADIEGTPLNQIEVRCGKRLVKWNNLRRAINEFMSSDELKINEDKLLGPFFINPRALTAERFADVFKDKVLLYLFEDVGKTKRTKMFRKELKTYSQVCEAFDEKGEWIFGSGFDDHIVFPDGETDSDDSAEPRE